MKLLLSDSKSIRINYTTILVALAFSYLLDSVYLISLSPVLKKIQLALQYTLLIVMAMCIFTNRMSARQIYISAVSVSVFLLSLFFSRKFVLIKYALVLLFVMCFNTGALYRKLFKVYSVTIAVIFVLGATGIIPSTTVRRGYSTFGFIHSNIFAAHIFAMLCCYVIMQEKKLNSKNYCVLIACILFTWLLTDSRTTVITMIAFVTLLVLLERSKLLWFRKPIYYYLLMLLPFLMLVISYWVGSNFTEESAFFRKLNHILNARASMASGFMTVLTPKLWGQHIEIGLVENAYLVSLYNYGIIPTMLELIMLSIAIKNSLDQKNYRKAASLVAFSVHGFAEVTTINPFFNVALLTSLSDMINKDKRKY